MLLVGMGAVSLLLSTDVDSAKLDAIRTGGTLGVGLGGVLVLWLGIRRQRSTELDLLAKYEAHELAERTAANTLAQQQRAAADAWHDASERRVTDLYARAADQLGADKAAVRLAGLYALERLAQDVPAQREAAGNVLCAYLRMPFRPTNELQEGADQAIRDRHDTIAQEQEVRQAALDILKRHTNPSGPSHWPESTIRLQRANLAGAYLGCAYLSKAYLSGADLTETSLAGADLNGADLRAADLRGADLRGGDLSGADLSNADLRGANLNGADLSRANLRETDLRAAKLNDAVLVRAAMIGADLGDTTLRNANLADANLAGANLIGADTYRVNLAKANLRGAHFDIPDRDAQTVDLSDS
jgi:uncharacterized protein YjbI with pentapeptide repeats